MDEIISDPVFRTGHSAFDKQTTTISCGNVSYPTMIGKRIDGWNGKVEDFDRDIGDFSGLTYSMYHQLQQLAKRGPFKIYEFFHHDHGKKIVHGYLVDAWNDGERYCTRWYTGPTYKSRLVVNKCAERIAKQCGSC